jgi:hypothetical protein
MQAYCISYSYMYDMWAITRDVFIVLSTTFLPRFPIHVAGRVLDFKHSYLTLRWFFFLFE